MITGRNQCCFVGTLIPFVMGDLNREQWAFFLKSPSITVHIHPGIDPNVFSVFYSPYLSVSGNISGF